MSSKVLEEKLPTKLNFGIWFRIMKYAMKRVDLFAIIILTMFITTFYDSAFVPAMNRLPLHWLDKLAFYPLSLPFGSFHYTLFSSKTFGKSILRS